RGPRTLGERRYDGEGSERNPWWSLALGRGGEKVMAQLEPQEGARQLPPGGAETVQRQPAPAAALDGAGGGEALGRPSPAEAGDQHLKQAVQAVAVAGRLAAVAASDHGGQQGLKQRPDILGEFAGEVGQLPGRGLVKGSASPVSVGPPGGFVSLSLSTCPELRAQ